MKKKGKIHLRRYIIMLFLFCLLLDDVSDFILGFYAGFRGYEENYAQSALEENWVPRILTLVIFVLIGLFYDWQIKHKVTAPVERLADGMRKVSQENLDVRVPVEGSFEFGQMEQTKQANGLLDTMLSYAKLQNENYILKKERILQSAYAPVWPIIILRLNSQE